MSDGRKSEERGEADPAEAGSVAADVAQAEVDRLVAFVARLSALAATETDAQARAAAQDRNRAAFEAMNDALAAQALEKARGAIDEMRAALRRPPADERSANETRDETHGPTADQFGETATDPRPSARQRLADAPRGDPLADALRDIDAIRDHEIEVLLRRFEREAASAVAAAEADAKAATPADRAERSDASGPSAA